MRKVISSKNTQGHIVQVYKFRSLGAGGTSSKEAEKEASGFDGGGFTPFQEAYAHHGTSTIAPSSQPSIDPKFVDELMKKIDDLSTNLVKMEMQMERQQGEFAARLEEEKGRAYKDGFAEGQAKAMEELSADLQRQKSNVRDAIGKLNSVVADLKGRLSKFEGEMTQAALLIAQEVIELEVGQRSAKIAAAIARELIAQVADATRITLHVNPVDYSQFCSELAPDEQVIKVIEDQAVAPGGVVLHSEARNLDGTIATRIQNLKNSIMDHLGHD
ncbi:MAG: hypothetical protein K6347_07900 [Campylobacterales bacterium]